jgi:DNA (cytosine-5)-methyltransferase 1
MPRYPFAFVQADALAYLVGHGHEYDAIHASPPCHDWSKLASLSGHDDTGWLLAATRAALIRTGLPWVIENVPGAAMRPDIVLCGEMFGLGVRRHRWFETYPRLFGLMAPCAHSTPAVSVHGQPGGTSTRDGAMPVLADWKRAMGIDWMSARTLAQAIPPAYTDHVGGLLLSVMSVAVSA